MSKQASAALKLISDTTKLSVKLLYADQYLPEYMVRQLIADLRAVLDRLEQKLDARKEGDR
ncbi:hypothetical protein CCR95_20880 [Thiocystis minor]|uniref:hypothetical protein n=1 Tax=Thiocystis minor TaxID=61597 RepID=UPI0019136AC3|nr:hypothetical protein [Thiocystis minor]MBK5966461.1 hypothetical protein [Thiocystis minor]